MGAGRAEPAPDARQLAQDVIFAGTDKRKPLGMAEVQLTVDNTRRHAAH